MLTEENIRRVVIESPIHGPALFDALQEARRENGELKKDLAHAQRDVEQHRQEALNWRSDLKRERDAHEITRNAMKGVAEEAVAKVRKAWWEIFQEDLDINNLTTEKLIKAQARLRAYESATLDSPEVKEALENADSLLASDGALSSYEWISVLARALRAAQVRISVNEKEREAYAKTMLERCQSAEAKLALLTAPTSDEGIQKSPLCPDCCAENQEGPCAFCEIAALRRIVRQSKAKIAELETYVKQMEVSGRQLEKELRHKKSDIESAEAKLAECRKLYEAEKEARIKAWRDAEKAEAFKAWVHAYLEKKGVPAVIHDEHLAAGCRIGGRMDWVFAKLAASEAEVLRLSGLETVEARNALARVNAELVAMTSERDGLLGYKACHQSIRQLLGIADKGELGNPGDVSTLDRVEELAAAVGRAREAVVKIQRHIEAGPADVELTHATIACSELLDSLPHLRAPACEVCEETMEDHKRPCGNCGDPGHAKWECVLPAPDAKEGA